MHQLRIIQNYEKHFNKLKRPFIPAIAKEIFASKAMLILIWSFLQTLFL